MSSSTFTNREEKLAAEGRDKYRGTARIRLEVMHFPRNESRELDQTKLESLKKSFEKGQCDRVFRNHIPAVIDRSLLDEVLRNSDVSAKMLLSNTDPHPELKFPIGSQLHCLHGRHRIQAAREVFAPRQRWWTVDLYSADADHELQTALIEEYANEKPPTAGEIYCKIHKYRRELDSYSENRWWARLSKHESRCLTGLFRHKDLKAAFDNLLGIPGLWSGMRISTLNKMISMRCDEEVLAYLSHIKDVWSLLLGHNKQAMGMVDNSTVKALELMAPKHSKQDAQELHGQLVSGRIFAAFSLEDRETIWSVLRNVSGLIPSLFTFFADLKYLQACAGSMRHLVEPSPRHTVRMALDDVFFGGTDSWDLGYRHLWIYAMQNFRDLPAPLKQNTKKKNRLAKARTVTPNEVVLSDFAALADHMGFRSDQILALKQRSSDREIARNALLNARKPDRYQYSDHSLESHIEQIVRLFATAAPLSVDLTCPAFVSDDYTASGSRCGFPDEEAYARDARFLSTANLHIDIDEQGQTITSFFVRRSVYFAFFGRPSETRTRVGSRPSPHPDLNLEDVGPSLPMQESYSNPASNQERPAEFEQPRGEQESIAQQLLEPNRLPPERQDQNNVQDDITSLQRAERDQRDQRRGTQLDLARIIADGLASTSGSAADLEELVDLHQDLISTNGQHYGQTTEMQLQNMFPPLSQVRIEFKIHERDEWRTDRSLLVDPSEPSEVERVAKKYMRKGFRPFDTSLRLLVPRTCFQVVTADGTNTVLLIPENNIRVNNQLVLFEPPSDVGSSTDRRQKKGRH